MQIVLYYQQTLLKTLVRVLSNKCLGLLFRASSMLKFSRLQEKIIYVIYISPHRSWNFRLARFANKATKLRLLTDT